MDSQLRLLLRKYSVTQDAEDAMAFANASLRSNELVPTQIKIYGLKVSQNSEEYGWTEFYTLSALASFNHLVAWLESQNHEYTHNTEYRELVIDLRNQLVILSNENLTDFQAGSIVARIVNHLNQMNHYYHVRVRGHWNFEFADLKLDV